MTAVSILRNLPDDSALARYRGGWPVATHIAARTLEELGAQTRITLMANGVKRSKLPKPILLDRPTPQAQLDAKGPTTKPVSAPQRLPVGSRPTPSRSWVAALIAAGDATVEVVG